MKTFDYVIRDELAMHFGPAGRIAELASYYEDTTATIQMGTRTADIRRPMKVALMGLRKGDKVTVTCDGASEVELLDVLYQYFEEHI
jgi:phosphocarrier protein